MPAVRVTSRPAVPGYAQDLTVVAMEETDGVGASVSGSGASGRPDIRLTTSEPGSLVFAARFSYDLPAARALPVGWVALGQRVDRGALWSQYTNVPVPGEGQVVNVSDGAPAGRWHLAAVELAGDGDD